MQPQSRRAEGPPELLRACGFEIPFLENGASIQYDQGCGLAIALLEQDSSMKRLHLVVFLVGWPLGIGPAAWSAEQEPQANNSSRYEYRQEHDPNGIGKFYMGREIAIVMGHQAAEWLDRPERERE